MIAVRLLKYTALGVLGILWALLPLIIGTVITGWHVGPGWESVVVIVSGLVCAAWIGAHIVVIDDPFH